MKNLSFLMNAHPSYIENLFNLYKTGSEAIEPEWKQFFQGYDLGLSEQTTQVVIDEKLLVKELAVWSLIQAYRSRGHLLSDTNPIRTRKDRKALLSLQDFGLSEGDLQSKFIVAQETDCADQSLESVLHYLNKVYCRKIGFEFSHIEDQKRKLWLQHKIESGSLSDDYQLQDQEKKRILEKLNGAVVFEKFLHTKYVGQKRFSLEGGESTIPALDLIINHSSRHGVEEIVIGMAHRGRLNVLANIMGKTYDQIFSEFEGNSIPDLSFGSGDVKYHLGYSSMITNLNGKNVYLKLAPNPSHLEAVNPIVEGLSRAKADLLYQSDYDKILPVLIHGDAAIAGQGIVYEIIQMSQLDGYFTGGTIHFVINNQIGFTTDFEDARSSTYSTSVANVIQAPVFHVNGDDPEAVAFVSKLAVEYRQEFNSDVFIDMVCYRRHGHNEGDDPKFTQPHMYSLISEHKNVRDIYINKLSERGEIEKSIAKEMEDQFWSLLQNRLDLIKEHPLPYKYQEPELAWKKLKEISNNKIGDNPDTSISEERLIDVVDKLFMTPDGFNVLPKVKRILDSSKKLFEEGKLDWALSELLAYGSILTEGMNVRMSGQDVKRGTFSHRHAVLYDEIHNTEYIRLNSLSSIQGRYLIYNSLLSEFAVLGFEYGYSLSNPQQLVVWEAQFGDFANGAQVIFDQFIATAEVKWNRLSNLVLLLPHGYDGQGPEHSSARLERFLQAAAENNILVANISSPSNFFHLIRRQVKANFRKPLIVMSPKSLLRHPHCMSSYNEFTNTRTFQEVLEDPNQSDLKTDRIIFCSGQLYYDLLSKKEKFDKKNYAIVRIEQLYPFPKERIEGILSKNSATEIYWVQEEPRNMGAAEFVKSNWPSKNLNIISRPASAATAVGYKKNHDEQLKLILEKAFN
ncbi:MAG: 2-oxoglutarate dehydrogenase E1 component [Saprospiraceae bacterium]|nr:2-oxoglutarate dehydrogenase E1 component [Saprospiraceae bacterium]